LLGCSIRQESWQSGSLERTPSTTG